MRLGIAPATLRALPAVGAAIALGLASVLPAPAQEPSLPRVLARATEYVEALHAQLSGVVMEERYRQRASSPGFGRLGADSYERVTLRSDYLLVRPEGSERYFGFRDVFEANGSRVRDREERLTQLFLGGTLTEDRQVQGILTDSARYDTGDGVGRLPKCGSLPWRCAVSALRTAPCDRAPCSTWSQRQQQRAAERLRPVPSRKDGRRQAGPPSTGRERREPRQR